MGDLTRMKTEAIEKARATKQANKERFEAQTVTIDENWRILRSDPLNWEIQYKGKFNGYFPTLSSVLKRLPAKMLDETAKGDLSEVLRSLQAIQEVIEKAIP